MVDPIFLSESWLQKDLATPVAPAYYTPAIIRRLHDQTAPADHGMQICVIPEGDGLYGLTRIDFTLPHLGRVRAGTDTTITLANGLKAGAAITQAYALMSEEFETAKHRRDSVPQAIKLTGPTSIPGAEPLARLPSTLSEAEKPGITDVLQRLSSQWGKKTTLFKELPRKIIPAHELKFF